MAHASPIKLKNILTQENSSNCDSKINKIVEQKYEFLTAKRPLALAIRTNSMHSCIWYRIIIANTDADKP